MFSFIKKIFFSTILIILVGFFPFLSWGQEYWFELLCSFSISFFNTLIGYYLALISINRPDSIFYKYVYGGMLIRMFVVFSFSIYIISINIVIMTPYMLFLLFFYVVHQWIEISGWLKDFSNQKIQFNT